MAQHALLIGVSRFDDSRLAALNAPADDVKALGAVLRDRQRGGFDNVAISLDEDFLTVRDRLATLFADRDPDDLLLLYYSGHGILGRGNRLFLATPGSNLDRPQARSLSAAEIREQMDQTRAERQVVVLDCCHSGAFVEGAKGATAAPAVTQDTFDASATGRYVLTAADALQFAWDGDSLKSGTVADRTLSRFTSWVVDGLGRGEASPNDEWITMDALFRYVSRRAKAEASPATPQRYMDRSTGDLVIGRNPAAAGSAWREPLTKLAVTPVKSSTTRPRSIVEVFRSVQPHEVALWGVLFGIVLIFWSWALGIATWTASEPKFAVKSREVGYLAALNWSFTFTFLFPALLYTMTRTIRGLASALDRIHERGMVRKVDMEPERDRVLTSFWVTGSRTRAFFLTVGAIVIPAGYGLGEWFLNNFLRLVHLGPVPGYSDPGYTDYDWGLAGLMAEPEWPPVYRVVNASFDLLAFTCETALIGSLAAFFIVVLDLSQVIPSDRSGELLLVPDLRPSSEDVPDFLPGLEDERFGFEEFAYPLEQLLVASLLAYLICYLVRLEGAYMASTQYSSLAEFVQEDIFLGVRYLANGDIAEVIHHLFDLKVQQVRAVLASLLSLLISMASIATVLMTISGAARAARDNAQNALRDGSLKGVKGGKKAALERLKAMKVWPLGYITINMLIFWIVVALLTIWLYRIGLFTAGLVFALLLVRLVSSLTVKLSKSAA